MMSVGEHKTGVFDLVACFLLACVAGGSQFLLFALEMEKYAIVPAFAPSISYLFCAIVYLHLLQNLVPVTTALGQFLS
jgi:hypothetical protein